MKCPKCAYLGFETSERCRNCGYDFSLSVQAEPANELPLHNGDGPGAPLADFDLSGLDTSRASETAAGLDLDRLIGGDEPAAASRPTPMPRTSESGLPLFSPVGNDADDAPLVGVPRPARPPLSVRRTTPEIPRGRARVSRVTPRNDQAPMELELEPAVEPEISTDAALPREVTAGEPVAGVGARLAAALIDLVLLVAIDAAVLYLTLAIAGLTLAQAAVIPPIPLGAFFVLMNGGYLIVFTAASGQTIGKMISGIRVIGDDGNRVDLAGSLLRAAGCAASLLTLGLGYLPAFVSADRRALQDRIAGTRVVSVK
jgi:uncharacterized RDD family membrane protein YckC